MREFFSILILLFVVLPLSLGACATPDVDDVDTVTAKNDAQAEKIREELFPEIRAFFESADIGLYNLNGVNKYNFDIPDPDIVFLSRGEIYKRCYKTYNSIDKCRRARGLYLPKSNTIILGLKFNINNLYDRSAVAHEYFHHAQNMNGAQFKCSGQKEYETFAAQKEWASHEGWRLFFRYNRKYVGYWFSTLLNCPQGR